MVYVVAILVLAVSCRERAGERLLPWTRGTASPETAAVHIDAWRPLFIQTYRAMARRECLLLWFAALSWGAAFGMSLIVLPAVATQLAGYSAAEYSALNGSINLAAGMACFLLFGLVADSFGPLRMYRAAILAGLLACIAMLLVQPWWAGAAPVMAMTIAFQTLRLLSNVPYNAMALGLSARAVAATQMTLFNSPANLAVSMIGVLLEPLDKAGGPAAIFAAMAVFAGGALMLTLGIPGRARIAAEPQGPRTAGGTSRRR
jgi:PAT family beta-lactamase induction signal transducer AmpG